MVRSLCVLVLTLILTACGAFPGAPSAGFVNQTRHTDADLWTIWNTSQQSIARQIDLNPLQQSSGAPADIQPGDPRALSVMPRQLLVAARPDVASSVLLAATGDYRADPTGLIACPQPCNVRYAAAYSFYQQPLTRYASSWEFNGDNFSVILEYEFENQILSSLGYNMKWR
ncbi:MAG: hypothetical protein WB421_18745 [Terriglobales bacterium]|jgi:hypothetical protein